MKTPAIRTQTLTIADVSEWNPRFATELLRAAGPTGTLRTEINNEILDKAGPRAYELYVSVADEAAAKEEQAATTLKNWSMGTAVASAVIGTAFFVAPPLGWIAVCLATATGVVALVGPENLM